MPPATFPNALRVFTAARIAPLRDHLIEHLRTAPLPPRDMETIIVQSQGMRRWVTLQVADALGCAGSLELPFPGGFIQDVAERLTGGRAAAVDAERFTRDALTWRIDALLQKLPSEDAAYERLRAYLRASDDRMRFGLSARIASRFDEYQLYRADVLLAWEEGRDTPGFPHAEWQAALWRQLCSGEKGKANHQARRLRNAIEALKGSTPARLPARLTVFGVSTLPPLFIELLAALARHIPVTVYAAVLDGASAHPLASAFGGQGAEFLKLLAEQGGEFSSLDVPTPDSKGVLQSLQRELATRAVGDTPLSLASSDTSLRIHVAHGPLRELEVLRDQLLAALAADSTLRPHDMLLLVPDAATWAPIVDAAFGVQPDDVPRIPYRIADRPIRNTQPAAEALLRMLALHGGRFARSEVFGFLVHPLVRQAAGLSDTEVEDLEAVTQRANVRWGYDAAARKSLGLPSYEEASWRTGLDRLLLGVAAGRSDDDVLGVLAESGDTLGDPEPLARLAMWVDDLAAQLKLWDTKRTPSGWSAVLLDAVRKFLQPDDGNERQSFADVQGTLLALGRLGENAGYDAEVSFGVVRDWLEGALDDDGFGSGFLSGGMTVAALKPMRSIPFRIIAVAGLDDEAFPRRQRREAFDLLDWERHEGDRNVRSDDRQLFLDLILAAGDRLVLSYTGRAVRDNSERAPSVVIDELLDHLDRRSGDTARKALRVEHPLQPFSLVYFAADRDARLFTYSRAQATAAQASAARRNEDLPFVTTAAELPAVEGIREIALRDLTDFWENPAKFFCRRVLRLSLESGGDEAADEERFDVDYMTGGLVKSRILASHLAGKSDPERELRRFHSDGSLPPGEIGAAWHRALSAEVDAVIARVPLDVPARTVLIEINGKGWRLMGRLDGIRGDARYAVRAGSIRANHRIKAWVEHIAMCAASESGIAGLPSRTVLVGRKKEGEEWDRAVPDAVGVLSSLVGEMIAGLAAPAPFFPQAGCAFFDATYASVKPKKKGARKSEPKDPGREARKAFAEEVSEFGGMGGDCKDPYIALCFRGVDPMATRWREFERLTAVLFDPWMVPGGAA